MLNHILQTNLSLHTSVRSFNNKHNSSKKSLRNYRSSSSLFEHDKNYSSLDLIQMEKKYSANNYAPLPVVIDRSDRVFVWDPEGNQYYDFLSGYSALNQGHNHPKIIKALVEQAGKCTLTSRAFYNSVYPRYAKFITEYFGYDCVLPMNTGGEAIDTALKVARKWSYVKKGVELDNAIVISAKNSFHGRTFGAIALAQFDSNKYFGPDLTGFVQVDYNSIDAMKEAMEEYSDRLAAVVLEPIQGEAGVNVPNDGYFAAVADLCKKHNALLIDDEIQTGVARTGKLLAADYEDVRPDMLVLGKAISGGAYPVSAVLADNEVMDVLKPGDHGSTYGGNPLGCAVAMAALEVVKEENLAENSYKLGKLFRDTLKADLKQYSFIQEIRGKGLLNAVVVDPNYSKTATDLCLILKSNGLLAKPTHDHIIRFSPPLVISEDEMIHALSIIRDSVAKFAQD